MDYFIHLAIIGLFYVIPAVTLNLVVGFTGLLSVTHVAFAGIGAYAVAVLTTQYHVNFFLAACVGMIFAGVASLLVGLVFSKFRGDYYALGTVGFMVITYTVFQNWERFTRGPLGIPGIPRPEVFGFTFDKNIYFLILAACITSAIYFLSDAISRSSFGRVLKAIREDESAIQMFGYRISRYKLTVFVASAMLTSLAGALYAAYTAFINPASFTLFDSIFNLTVIIFGGLASLRGSVLGAFLLVLLPEFLRFVGMPPDIAAQMRQLIFGAILVIFMLYRPQGLMGEYKL